MRLIILLLLLSAIQSSFSQQRTKRPEPNFYKNLYTLEFLDKTEYREFINTLLTEYNDSINGKANIAIHFKKRLVSNDTVIQPFDYDIIVGNEYKIRAQTPEKIGISISPRKFQTISGDSIQIGGKQSKPTLINLWFIHCPGCIAEIPALNKLHEKYADKVNFIALTFEEEKDVLTFLRAKDFKFEHVAEVNDFIKEIGSKPYPENIFLDRNGVIRNVEGGLGDSKDFDIILEYFESIIQKLLLPAKV